MTSAATSATPASGSTSSGNANTAAAVTMASRPDDANDTGLTLTKGLEQLEPDAIRAAFLGEEITLPDNRTDKKATDTTEETETDEAETDSENGPEEETSETAEEAGDEAEEGEETEDGQEPESQLEKGLLKELAGKPGLHKRVKQLFAQNKELKDKIAAAEAAPAPLILAPTQATKQLFSDAKSEAEIEQQAQATLANARAKLRWLNRHLDGGTYGEGETALEMTAADVDQAIDHFEGLIPQVETAKAARKEWLKEYASTAKAVPGVVDLVNPKTPHRESEVIRQIPELMRRADYLLLLSDLKSGRELREKQAKGIKLVEVKPGDKAAATPTPTPGTQRAAVKPARPAVQTPTGKPLDRDKLQELRQRAADNDPDAQDAIREAFLNS